MMGAAYTADRYFYPRPPRGGRPQERLLHSTRKYISIHALREEGDRDFGVSELDYIQFLSTPSARRATHVDGPISVQLVEFLSTPSARRATV